MTRAWLDQRYQRRSESGVYVAHQPIYGLGTTCAEPNQVPRLARTFQILKVLNRCEFSTFLDVGASEGHLAYLVRELFGAEVFVGDLSAQAAMRAHELFGLAGIGLDSSRLPFADDSFDVVCCSEVIEHVEHPVPVLAELGRVTRRATLVTSEEVTSDPERIAGHEEERRDLPHAERNLFQVADFELMFGAPGHWRPGSTGLAIRSQYVGAPPPEPTTMDEAREWIRAATNVDRWSESGVGAVVLAPKNGSVEREPRRSLNDILDAVLAVAHDEAATTATVSPGIAALPEGAKAICPISRADLEDDADAVRCPANGRSYPKTGGVPALFDEDATDVTEDDLRSLLTERWNDARRVDAALALRRRLYLPDATTELDWSFENAGDREAWTTNEDLRAREEGTFRWTSVGADPWLVGPMCVLPDDGAGLLELEMRIHNPDFPVDAGVGQVFWMGTGDLSFDEAACVTFPLVNDGEMRTYRVPVGEHPRWPASGALWLRLDPVNGPAEVDLASLRLVSEKDSGPAT